MSFWTENFWTSNFWTSGFWASSVPPSSLVSCAEANGNLYDEFVQTADSSSFTSQVSGQEYVSQSWTSGATPYEIRGLCLRLRKQGTPTGTISVAIRAHTGTYGTSSEPTGADLVASVEFDASELTTSYVNYFFALSGWTPSPSTQYTFICDMSGVSSDASNYARLVYEIGAEATHAGNAATSADGSTWLVAANVDIPFKLYHASPATSGGHHTSRGFNFLRRRRVP